MKLQLYFKLYLTVALALGAVNYSFADDTVTSSPSLFFSHSSASQNKNNAGSTHSRWLNNNNSHSSNIFSNKPSNNPPRKNFSDSQNNKSTATAYRAPGESYDKDKSKAQFLSSAATKGRGHGYGRQKPNPPRVPEPVSSALFLIGAGTLALRHVRKNKANRE